MSQVKFSFHAKANQSRCFFLKEIRFASSGRCDTPTLRRLVTHPTNSSGSLGSCSRVELTSLDAMTNSSGSPLFGFLIMQLR
jgi:hypothetical protein